MTPAPPARAGSERLPRALLLHVEGVAQGVGFRPFVHRLALRHGLRGWVRNGAGGVQIAIEGEPEEMAGFVAALRTQAPPLARLGAIVQEPMPPTGLASFSILESTDDPAARQPVSPDVATCAACEGELHAASDRRHHYPFITCTDCGPRYTIIEAMPYDRERTSMRAFAQCDPCRAEYQRPGDRRYRSETNSCPACGPRLWVVEGGPHAPAELRPHPPDSSPRSPVGEAERRSGRGGELQRAEAKDGMGPDASAGYNSHRTSALERAAELLLAGQVLAIRGLGGFHLAVDATQERAVRRLRERKRREGKPLAVMVRTLAEAAALGEVGAEEAELLATPERPIVLLRRRPDSVLAPSVAPGVDTVGVMLAYTPLHSLLLARVGRPLVMTSGNLSEEPIAAAIREARRRLAGIADAFLLHDRDIVARCDDSVLRVVDGAPVFLRRARGYAPLPLELPLPAPHPLVAVGPHLKNTFTLACEEAAFVSPHIGDIEGLETLEHFRATLERYCQLFRLRPEIAVRDLHPGYLSTRVAEELGLEQIIAVQHHHAHIAAVLAEHGESGPVVGLAFDGTGYGDDGRVWGAEVLVADLCGYRRVGHLRYAPLPGGDLAARRPWRAALGYLSLDRALEPAFARAFAEVRPAERQVAEQQLARGVNTPLASSMGRLFDAAAAVLGLRGASAYEGQAAMELEALAGKAGKDEGRELPFPVRAGEGEAAGRWVMDPLPLLGALGAGVQRGEDPVMLAVGFHQAVARGAAEVALRVCEAEGLGRVALGGGVFQNARLLSWVRASLESAGVRVLVPRLLSPNDGAISYGQAAVAAALLQRQAS